MANMRVITKQKNLARCLHCSCHEKTAQNYKADLV